MSMLFAATYPRRCAGLVLFGSFARSIWSSDYPWAMTTEQWRAWDDATVDGWGVPSADLDPELAREAAAIQRHGASPGAARALLQMNMEIDVRHVLSLDRRADARAAQEGRLDLVRGREVDRRQDRRRQVRRAVWVAARVLHRDVDRRLPRSSSSSATSGTTECRATPASPSACSRRFSSPTWSARPPRRPSSANSLARVRPGPPRNHQAPAGPVSRHRARHGRRRLLRILRRPGPRDPLRLRDPRERPRARDRDPRGATRRRVRADRPEGRWDRGEHRRARCVEEGGTGGRAGLEHREGSRRRVRDRV